MYFYKYGDQIILISKTLAFFNLRKNANQRKGDF